MKIKTQITATTTPVKGVVIPLEGLKSMAEQINSHYIPYTVEHDIRIPPIGRTASAEIVELKDGFYGLKSIFEIFEESDSEYSIDGDGRTLRIMEDDVETISVTSDNYLKNSNHDDLIKELSTITSDINLSEKRSGEPISTIVLYLGFFILGAIGNGFFGKMGSDAYDKLKNALMNYYKKDKQNQDLLDIELIINKKHPLQVDIVVDPSEKNIEKFFDSKMGILDSLISDVLKRQPNISKIVFEYKEGKYKPLYAIRADGFPIDLSK